MTTLYATLAGIGFGAGIVAVAMWWMGISFTSDRTDAKESLLSRFGPRLIWGVVVGVALLALTRMIALALAIGLLIVFWNVLFGGAAEAKAQIAKLEALAAWTEAIRDSIASGAGLLEALRSTSSRPPAELSGPLAELSGRLHNREPLETCLRGLADEVDDHVGDEVIAALILNARVQGRQLQAVLTGLSEATRRTVESRRDVEADRAKMRRGVQIIMFAIGLVVVFLFTLGRSYAEPFTTPVGQVVLAVVMAVFTGSFLFMRQLSIYQTPARFLRQRRDV